MRLFVLHQPVVENPAVLSHTTRLHKKHQGNVRARSMVHLQMAEYFQAEKGEKQSITLKLMQSIQSEGGRFLKQNDNSGWWEHVTEKDALLKLAKMFRNEIALVKKEAGKRNDTGSQAVQASNSSTKRVKVSSDDEGSSSKSPFFNCCSPAASAENKIDVGMAFM